MAPPREAFGMKRERAFAIAEDLLLRLEENRDEWPANLVTEVYIFGSVARGALEPHDRRAR
jgi:predicted nucleotidyltransferase